MSRIVGYAAMGVDGTGAVHWSGGRASKEKIDEWAKPFDSIVFWPLCPEPPDQIAAAQRLGLPLPHWQNWPEVKS